MGCPHMRNVFEASALGRRVCKILGSGVGAVIVESKDVESITMLREKFRFVCSSSISLFHHLFFLRS